MIGTRLNNFAGKRKIGIGGVVVTLVFTVVIITLETYTPSCGKLNNGNDFFFSCLQTAKQRWGQNVTTFLHCTVNERKSSVPDNIRAGAVVQQNMSEENTMMSTKKKTMRSDSLLLHSSPLKQTSSPHIEQTEQYQENAEKTNTSMEQSTTSAAVPSTEQSNALSDIEVKSLRSRNIYHSTRHMEQTTSTSQEKINKESVVVQESVELQHTTQNRGVETAKEE